MRPVVSILLFFIILVRSYLPLIDYAINYNFISTQLCEKKDNPESLCNGKCYLKKEFSETEQNKSQPTEIKILSVDVFVVNENADFIALKKLVEINQNIPHRCTFSFQNHYKEIFHPPLV